MEMPIKAGTFFEINMGMCEEGGPDQYRIFKALADFDLLERFQSFAAEYNAETKQGGHRPFERDVSSATVVFGRSLEEQGLVESIQIARTLHLHQGSAEDFEDLNLEMVEQTEEDVFVVGDTE